jgi:hypothetical protein
MKKFLLTLSFLFSGNAFAEVDKGAEICHTELNFCMVYTATPQGRPATLYAEQSVYDSLSDAIKTAITDTGFELRVLTSREQYDSYRVGKPRQTHNLVDDLAQVDGVSDEAWDVIYSALGGCGGGVVACIGGTAAASDAGGPVGAMIFAKIGCGVVGLACYDAIRKYDKWVKLQEALEKLDQQEEAKAEVKNTGGGSPAGLEPTSGPGAGGGSSVGTGGFLTPKDPTSTEV